MIAENLLTLAGSSLGFSAIFGLSSCRVFGLIVEDFVSVAFSFTLALITGSALTSGSLVVSVLVVCSFAVWPTEGLGAVSFTFDLVSSFFAVSLRFLSGGLDWLLRSFLLASLFINSEYSS